MLHGKLTSLTSAYYDTNCDFHLYLMGRLTVLIFLQMVFLHYLYNDRDTGLDISGLTPGSTYNVTNVRNSAGFVLEMLYHLLHYLRLTDFTATTIVVLLFSVVWTTYGTFLLYHYYEYNRWFLRCCYRQQRNIYHILILVYLIKYTILCRLYLSTVGGGYAVKTPSNVTYGKLTELYTALCNYRRGCCIDGSSFAECWCFTNGVFYYIYN
jgi:hypothetical protein